MRGSIRRRTVYAGTIVAMLALAGGFALASTFVFNSTASQGQNGYSIQTAATNWTFSSATASVNPNSACSTSGSITITTPGVSPSATSVSIPGASGGTCATTHFAEEYAFSGTISAASTSDLYTVISVIATGSNTCTSGAVSEANTITITTSGGSATSTTVTLDLWVDYGPATTTSVCDVNIAISGY